MSKVYSLRNWFDIETAVKYLVSILASEVITPSDLIDFTVEGKLSASVRFDKHSHFLANAQIAVVPNHEDIADFGQLLHGFDENTHKYFILPQPIKHFEHDLFKGIRSAGSFSLCLTLGSIEYLRSVKNNNNSTHEVTTSKPLFFERDGDYFLLTKLPDEILNNERFCIAGETEGLEQSDYIAYELGKTCEIGFLKEELDRFVQLISEPAKEKKGNTRENNNIGKIIAALAEMAELDITKPHVAYNKIADAASIADITLPSEDTVAKWLKTANSARQEF